MVDLSAVPNWHERPALERAQHLAAQGLSIIPIRPGTKVPAGGWSEFQERRASADELARWFSRFPDRPMGIVTGAVSGLVAVDCDSPEALEWAEAHLPTTPIVTLTSQKAPGFRGRHLFFRHPGSGQHVANRARIRTPDGSLALDVRGDGGQVLAPGSPHPDGGRYEPVGQWSAAALASCPVFDPAWLTPSEEPAAPPLPAAPNGGRPRNGNGRAAHTAGRPSLEERAADYLRTMGPAVQGQGGDAHTTRAAWAVAVEFGLDEGAARRVLLEWDAGNRPPWQNTQPEGLEAKLRSALTKAPGHRDFARLAAEDRSGTAPRGNVVPLRPPGRQEDAPAPRQEEPAAPKKPTAQAKRLLALAARATLFRTPAGEAHVTLQARGRQETWPVRGKVFASWLRHEFMIAEGSPVRPDPLKQAVETLEARALHGPAADVREVYVRSAGDGGRVYLDLADAEGRAVSICPEGWDLTVAPPVAFRRPREAQGLPVPARPGGWDGLRPLLNLDEDGWILFVAFLLGALAPRGPYPLLIVEGVQGSAKSSLARAARALLDPSALDIQRPPDQERDLFIRAGNCRLLALDNLTRPPRWLSDALCALATGGGYACRELHTDREEAVFRSCLPVILTGIEGLATGDDLADRAIVLSLAAIPPEARLQDAEFERRLLATRPLVLGALCDAAAGALARREQVKSPGGLPRMADFAAWVLAAEEAGALPWERGRFLAALSANRGAASAVGLERDLLASTLADFMAERSEWTGTAAALLADLETRLPEGARRSKSWPGAAHILTARLPRIEPLLREAGILVGKSRGTDRKRLRLLTLRRAEEPDAPSTDQEPSAEQGDLWEEGIL